LVNVNGDMAGVLPLTQPLRHARGQNGGAELAQDRHPSVERVAP